MSEGKTRDVKSPVWFGRCPKYDADALARLAGEGLEAAGFSPKPGTRVLVKPNLLWADPQGLGYTHPLLTRAACLYLLDSGCRVEVSDSPGFGRAGRVAAVTGLADALASLPGGLKVQEMGPTEKRPLSLGGYVPVARRALEADAILSLPRLKAHRMMRFSGAVKNLFGCVSGVKKAVLHSRHGDKQKDGASVFPSLIADLTHILPPSAALLDGVTGMHKTGPMKGTRLEVGLIGASASAVALDTALYSLLGREPDFFPIWAELQRRGAQGAFADELDWRGLAPGDFDLSGFELPEELSPASFNPLNLCISGAKRAFAYLRQ